MLKYHPVRVFLVPYHAWNRIPYVPLVHRVEQGNFITLFQFIHFYFFNCKKSWPSNPVFFKPPVGNDSEEEAQAIFDQNKDWKTTSEMMDLTAKNSIYLHCLPADRGYEVNNDVIDKTEGSGWRSVVYDEAENRLHVQKAVMSLVM